MIDDLFKNCSFFILYKSKNMENKYRPNTTLRLKYNETKNYQHIGLILPTNYCFIDCDSKDAANSMRNIIKKLNLKCYEIETDRGSHFGFKTNNKIKQWVDKPNFYGIPCDFKCYNETNTVYERIKSDDEPRKVIKYNITSLEDLDYLPKAFYKSNGQVFLNMKDGDGRDTYIHNHQITLKKAGFNYDEAYNIVSLINDYVFKDKLETTELNTCFRLSEWDKIKIEIDKFILDTFIDKIFETEVIYKYSDNLLWWIDNKYTSDEKYTIPGYIAQLTHGNNLTPNRIGDVMLKLKQSSNIDTKIPNNNYIICKNGQLYDIMEGKVIDNTSEIFSIINYNYNFIEEYTDDIKEFNGSVVKDFIYHCSCNKDGTFDKQKETQLLEMIGNCLIPNKALNRAYFIKGNGANGKSKLKVLIETISGTHCSFVTTDDFDSDFKRANMFNPEVTCNLQDDFSNEIIGNIGTFKSIITGANMLVNPKYGKAEVKKCAATLIICTNEWPRFKTDDDALNRRLVFFELENLPKKVNINLETDLINDTEGQQWLFTVALKAITNALQKGELTETEISKQMKDIRHTAIDSVLEFMFEYYYDGPELKYDDTGNILNNDYENIDISMKSSQDILNDYTIYKNGNVGTGVTTTRITRTINKYLSKYYKLTETNIKGKRKAWLKR